MDIQDLKENVISEILEFRGFEVKLKIKPDADTDAEATNAEFVAAKLTEWDLTDKGEAVAITVENLQAMPPVLFTAILGKIYEVQNAPLGKLTTAAG